MSGEIGGLSSLSAASPLALLATASLWIFRPEIGLGLREDPFSLARKSAMAAVGVATVLADAAAGEPAATETRAAGSSGGRLFRACCSGRRFGQAKLHQGGTGL